MSTNPLTRALAQGIDDDDRLIADGVDLDFDIDDELNSYLVFTCRHCGEVNKLQANRLEDGQCFACAACAKQAVCLAGEDFTKVNMALIDMQVVLGTAPEGAAGSGPQGAPGGCGACRRR